MDKIAKVLRIALIQIKIGKNKNENLVRAMEKVKSVSEELKPKLIALPGRFNVLELRKFAELADVIPHSYTCEVLSKTANKCGIYLVAGAIPERDPVHRNIIYNTCTVWAPNGDLVAKYRKIHLADFHFPGKMDIRESRFVTPGNSLTTFTVDGIKIGLGICYDIRFEEMSRLYRNEGCKMLLFPACFNQTTGYLHWELLQRARAADSQCFVVTVSQARDEKLEIVSWAHSMIVDPWGQIVKQAGINEETVVADLDFAVCDEVRKQMPTSKQRENKFYETVFKTDLAQS